MERPELTEQTTRWEYLQQIAQSYAGTAKFGGNTAILEHVCKLHYMLDADWPAHREKLLASRNDPARCACISNMVAEVMLLQERGR